MYLFFDKRWWIILKKHNEIWIKVKNSNRKEFHSEPVYDEKYLKATRFFVSKSIFGFKVRVL